ncbi:Transthyretin-like protein [Trichinella spiralis]|uniref:Transthyretin-like protein n=1 Tax=Trichinella spiralis TaxID=6334 RepID=A0ABR3KUQ1_TRISP
MRFRIFILFTLIIIYTITPSEGRTRCVKAIGKLICKANATHAVDVEIELFDDDGFLNPDDQMGWTTSNDDGTFHVEGCGYDFLSDPDPYLKIWHACGGGSHRYYRTPIQMIFQPEVNDFGEIVLDQE